MISPPPSYSSAEWNSLPGTVADTLTKPDKSQVLLDGMMFRQQKGSYIFVSDPWGSELFPVYAPTSVKMENGWSLEVTGRTDTVSGKRIVVVTRLRLYVDSKGTPFWNMPKPHEKSDWLWMREIPL